MSSNGDEGAGVAGDKSLEARVAREHEQLAPLFEATRDALTRGQAGAVRVPLGRLRAALESHTTQEDQLYYPALWSLCPQRKNALEHFIRSHAGFQSDLDEMMRCLDRDDVSEAASRFDAFYRTFAAHEVYEEELLREIDAESPWDTPASP